MTELRRTGKQAFKNAVIFLLVAGLAVWNLRDGLAMGSTWLTLLGVVFVLWAAFSGLNLLRRRWYVRWDDAGVAIRYVTRDLHIAWDAMVWHQIDDARPAGVIAYDHAGQERFGAFTRNALGADGMMQLRAAIEARRPDLPDRNPRAGAA